MTSKVFALDTKPGIQRDGTVFDMNFYTDGQWVRFQRSRPRKMGGYNQITGAMIGPSRGIYVNPQQGFTNIFNGHAQGLQVLPVNSLGLGAGVVDVTLSGFTISDKNVWQFDTLTDVSGVSQNNLLLAHPGQNLVLLDNDTNTSVLQGPIAGSSLSPMGVFTLSGMSTTNGSAIVSYLPANTLVGAGQLVSGTGITTGTTVSSVVEADETLASVAVTGVAGQCSCTSTSGLLVGQTVTVGGVLTGTATGITTGRTYYIIATNGKTTFTLSATSGGAAITTTAGTTTGLTFITGNYTKITLSANATADAVSTLTFDNQISVSGGVVSLHPYVFVYGNNGLIKNCAAGNTSDWVSADANEVNVATGKIVQGLPVRGGSNSPSGLFWSLDSLIRVSYIGGTGTPVQYWRYDIITSQSSILSSQSVIEYDGIYYWCGVDRFLMYNGVVKEVPNDFNQNYFFDNLNFAQRQKVWATKVPRYGEIWWFYPRGDATECTDAVIYNVRMNCWYDAGSAQGAQRSAGYFSQIFHYPVNADWNINYTGGAATGAIVNPGSGYTNGTYTYQDLTGGTGTGAQATIVVSGGVVTSVTITAAGYDYAVGNLLSASLPAGAGFSYELETINSYVNLWQHEIGTDEVRDGLALAVPSFFETSDLGLVAGGPSEAQMVGLNKWLRIERVEPDFIMSGEMECYITGRPYAQSEDKVSQPYIFDANTNKIDMKEQRRELRVGFRSNTIGGNYQLGRLLLDADTGDTRGY